MKSAIVISASSDIGSALVKDWLNKGWQVCGTYKRTRPDLACDLVYCDLLDKNSIKIAVEKIRSTLSKWDVLLFAPGTLNPIGLFQEVPFEEWEKGYQVNFLHPLFMLHELLSFRSGQQSSVLFFAGAGTNGAAPHYSCYALSKIALIKACELLDEEIADTKFMIVGPGWVKTKIHQETIEAKDQAGKNFQRTLERLEKNECTSMEEVVNCCNWLVTNSLRDIGGRNYSVVHDRWGTKELELMLSQNPDMYKLRREGNQVLQ